MSTRAAADHGPGDADRIAWDGSLCIRRSRDAAAEYAQIAWWMNQPHVKHWWDPDLPPATPESVARDYPAAGDDPGVNCLIELDGRPVGFIQFYRWSWYPEERAMLGVAVDADAWGLDVLIGERALLDRGIGSRAVDLLCRRLERHECASAVLLVTDVENLRAHRAYEKVGFVTVNEILDTDTRHGERVRSHVMRRSSGSALADRPPQRPR